MKKEGRVKPKQDPITCSVIFEEYHDVTNTLSMTIVVAFITGGVSSLSSGFTEKQLSVVAISGMLVILTSLFAIRDEYIKLKCKHHRDMKRLLKGMASWLMYNTMKKGFCVFSGAALLEAITGYGGGLTAITYYMIPIIPLSFGYMFSLSSYLRLRGDLYS